MNFVGNLLIAPPAVKNSFWHKTVIMVTEHSAQGTLGLVLNKPSTLSIRDFGRELGMMLNVPGMVYVGGPINNQSLSLLHTSDWLSKNTLRVNNKFSLSSADDVLPRLATGDCPKEWRLFLGMSGWANGQLLNEIQGTGDYKKETSWITATPDINLIFESDGTGQWCAALDHSATEFAQNILL
jgi:putative transcriptional regulator